MRKILYSIAAAFLLTIPGASSGEKTVPAACPAPQEAPQNSISAPSGEITLEESALSKAYALYLKKDLYNYGKRIFLTAKGAPVEIDNISHFRLSSIRVTQLILRGKGKALFEVSIEFSVNGRFVYAAGLMSEKGELDVLMLNFLTDDPKVRYPHFRNWELIRKGIIRPGMKEAEVILSWGSPLSIKKSKVRGGMYDEWGYPSTFLYFKNGILNTMHDF